MAPDFPLVLAVVTMAATNTNVITIITFHSHGGCTIIVASYFAAAQGFFIQNGHLDRSLKLLDE